MAVGKLSASSTKKPLHKDAVIQVRKYSNNLEDGSDQWGSRLLSGIPLGKDFNEVYHKTILLQMD